MNTRKAIFLVLLALCIVATTGAGVSFYQLRQSRANAASLAARLDKISPARGHEHSDVRQWMIRQHLARVGPVVVLGDSITEAATLPATICDHAVVNAGIGGANVRSALDVLPSLLGGAAPALIVIALGTNDAYAAPNKIATFVETYEQLLQQAGKIAPRLAVASIPSIDAKGPVAAAAGMDAAVSEKLNDELPRLATRVGAVFIDVRKAINEDSSAPTIDGVHLTPRAYDYWRVEMQAGIQKALKCGAVSEAP